MVQNDFALRNRAEPTEVLFKLIVVKLELEEREDALVARTIGSYEKLLALSRLSDLHLKEDSSRTGNSVAVPRCFYAGRCAAEPAFDRCRCLA